MGTKEFVLALAIVGAAAWTAKADGPAPTQDLVVKGRLIVGGDAGRGSVVIGTLDGNPFVHLKDARGVARASVQVLPEGVVSLSLASARGEDRLVGLVDEPGAASLTAFAADGKRYLEMRAGAKALWFSASDSQEKLRAVLGTANGTELLRLLDADGATTGQLGPR